MTQTSLPALSAVPSTLRIPLAARALGGTLFPQLAAEDRYAADALRLMGDNGQTWLRDRQSVYGVLARTRRFCEQAQAFVARTPAAHVVNLGCGLSQYLQWIDNGELRMTDADLAEVVALRRRILPPPQARQQLVELDLNDADWWDALGLPATRDAEPVFLMSEGVFMYLDPATVAQVLATFGERAPAGSILTFDVMCWLAVGRADRHPSVGKTDAQFRWGPRKLADLTRPHARLRLQRHDEVMRGFNPFYRLMQPVFKVLTGVPLYAVYGLTVQD
ncbi:class I SAM-dependent methyltransferase [Achromobacter spanius]|uniref:Poly(3-hydroxyalkanoate) synthetase n=1 Tax=Achromobacter spanius TaxID=217203 RepID=A0A2S0I2T5_9BURK|nr:class I SAM-dependent methyltransferase [Achromobacter spanius]AVJ26342.1 poly(3-hydroxyalkanoate) synthetase [Achromobacter spanius]